ncbi:hypothetical protein Tco_1380394, partial [Tanacetum coccineum]
HPNVTIPLRCHDFGGVTQRESKERLICSLENWDLKAEQLDKDDIKQKSIVRWVVESDENSRFFLSLLRNKFANFTIKGMNVDGSWCYNLALIKNLALDHFSNKFKERTEPIPWFRIPLFRKLSTLDAVFLESEISMDEVNMMCGVARGQNLLV